MLCCAVATLSNVKGRLVNWQTRLTPQHCVCAHMYPKSGACISVVIVYIYITFRISGECFVHKSERYFSRLNYFTFVISEHFMDAKMNGYWISLFRKVVR